MAIGLLIALAWAYMAMSNYEHFWHYDLGHLPHILGGHHLTPHYIVNDMLMTGFFCLVILEMRRDLIRGGDLGSWSVRFSTAFGTVGGMLGPYVIYKLLSNAYMPEIANGFAVPMATDIVFADMIARVVFGKGNHPARVYLRALAILDDLGTTVIIAVFYGDGTDWLGLLPWALAIFFFGAYVHGYQKRPSIWPYFWMIVPAWAVHAHFGVHPAICAILTVWFIPHESSSKANYFPGGYVWDTEEKHGILSIMEHRLRRGIVPFILFSFGLANGGITLGLGGGTTYIVLVALMIGKPMGIIISASIGHTIGFRIPAGVRWADIMIVGFAAGIGFTVSIFVSNLAFDDPVILDHAKLGATASFMSGLIAIALKRPLRVVPHDVQDEATNKEDGDTKHLQLELAISS